MLPDRIGNYIIERQLGSGGMGNVYLGRDDATGAFAAIKELPASLAREEGFVARFHREIEVLRSLNHPQIVRLYGCGTDRDTHYYAMEYVEGETLTQRLKREKRIPWREVVSLGILICGALKAAHDIGVIHRDLKPSNLLLTPDGKVKLTDFGVAQVFASGKLTATGGVIGTAEYMSPEQAQGTRSSRRSDLYSLGSVLYVMLVGKPPFQGSSAAEILNKHRFGQFDKPKSFLPELPSLVDEIVCQLLEKDPSKRPPDAYVLGKKLQEIQRRVDFQIEAAQGTYHSRLEGGETTSRQPAGSPSSDFPPIELGPTFVRDLVRAEIDLQNRQSLFSRILNNTYVLLILFALVTGGGVYLFLNTGIEPEEQFEIAKDLLEGPPGPAWFRARDQYLIPLLQSDPVRWRDQVEPYLQKIEVYQIESTILPSRRRDRIDPPASEPERLLRLARAQLDAGDVPAAKMTFESLRILLEGNGQYEVLKTIVNNQIEALEREQVSRAERDAFIQTSFERAEKFQSEGKLENARQIWQGIITLYQDDPTATHWVEQAQSTLNSSP